MTDRRYTHDDVQRILALAAESDTDTVADSRWTLAEIQRVGSEAGLSPAAVAASALAIERRATAGEGRYFGLPVAVARSVPLQRQLSDDEWVRLVARLRDTFAASGRVEVSAGRREWRNGNLRVTHETLGDGALLELRTRRGDARPLMAAGGTLFGAATFVGAAALAVGDPRGMMVGAIVGAFGALALAMGALRLPAWARDRARQFDAIAGDARRLSGS